MIFWKKLKMDGTKKSPINMIGLGVVKNVGVFNSQWQCSNSRIRSAQ